MMIGASTATKKSLLLLAVVAILLITSLFSVAYLMWEGRRAEAWVVHTYQVKEALAEVLNSLLDFETAGRGFVIVGRDDFLEPAINAEKRLPAEFAQLRS